MKRYKVLANSISLPVSKRPTRIYSKGDETEIADDVAGPLLKQKAIELIKGCTQYVGTVRQGFGQMSKIAASELYKVLACGSAAEAEMYAPVDLITRESLGVTCP